MRIERLYERLVQAQSAVGRKYAHEGRKVIRRIDAIGRRWRERWGFRPFSR